MAFSGEYRHGIDEKGRLIMPARFRGSLGSSFMLSKGLEACLFAYPMDAWAKLEEKLNALSVFNRSNRDLKRRFFSGSDECEIDKQGRSLINQEFRSHANLTKEVYVVGAGDHLEIWDKDAWENYRSGLDDGFEALAEEVFQ
ncbi:MAG: division/cell wall cluster transcriptional repressor MraZ [Clostridiales bacterium]|nr:division/cell wall cluster transcriptional repressor MraZ [Clostridiales bacterium]